MTTTKMKTTKKTKTPPKVPLPRSKMVMKRIQLTCMERCTATTMMTRKHKKIKIMKIRKRSKGRLKRRKTKRN